MSRESLSLSFRGLPVHFSIVRPEAHLRHRVLLVVLSSADGLPLAQAASGAFGTGLPLRARRIARLWPGRGASAFPHDSATRARLVWGVLDEVDARIGGQNALWHLAAHGCACPTVMAMCAMQPDSVQSLVEISPLLPAGGRGAISSGRKGAAERIVDARPCLPVGFCGIRCARRPPALARLRRRAHVGRPFPSRRAQGAFASAGKQRTKCPRSADSARPWPSGAAAIL